MISYIDEFFRDPKGMLIFFLLAFPGRILALSLHEFGHAWVAHRCGDDTAKVLGRMKELWSYLMYSFEDPQTVWRKIKKINALKEYENAVESVFKEIAIK